MTDQNTQQDKGFTIIELIVVMSIFAIMSGVVIFRYQDFGAGIKLQNTVQEIALQFKRAQTNAVSGTYPRVVSSSQSIPADWKPSYGVYIDKDLPTKLFYFFDTNTEGSGMADAPSRARFADAGTMGSGWYCGEQSGSECLDELTITTGEKITDICVTTTTGELCNRESLTVVFTRPFPDSYIRYEPSVGNPAIKYVTIKISDANDVYSRAVVITPLGQISTKIITN